MMRLLLPIQLLLTIACILVAASAVQSVYGG
jgi:hypothetical protein